MNEASIAALALETLDPVAMNTPSARSGQNQASPSSYYYSDAEGQLHTEPASKGSHLSLNLFDSLLGNWFSCGAHEVMELEEPYIEKRPIVYTPRRKTSDTAFCPPAPRKCKMINKKKTRNFDFAEESIQAESYEDVSYSSFIDRAAGFDEEVTIRAHSFVDEERDTQLSRSSTSDYTSYYQQQRQPMSPPPISHGHSMHDDDGTEAAAEPRETKDQQERGKAAPQFVFDTPLIFNQDKKGNDDDNNLTSQGGVESIHTVFSLPRATSMSSTSQTETTASCSTFGSSGSFDNHTASTNVTNSSSVLSTSSHTYHSIEHDQGHGHQHHHHHHNSCRQALRNVQAQAKRNRVERERHIAQLRKNRTNKKSISRSNSFHGRPVFSESLSELSLRHAPAWTSTATMDQ